VTAGGWPLSVGGWWLVVGGWRLAVGGWRLARPSPLAGRREGASSGGRTVTWLRNLSSFSTGSNQVFELPPVRPQWARAESALRALGRRALGAECGTLGAGC
jgi:hypothetical protein